MSKKVLGKKKRQKRRQNRTLGPGEGCQEPISRVKQRVKDAKEDIRTIMDLIDGSDVIDYDIRYELVGKAHMNLHYAKAELKRRKATK